MLSLAQCCCCRRSTTKTPRLVHRGCCCCVLHSTITKHRVYSTVIAAAVCFYLDYCKPGATHPFLPTEPYRMISQGFYSRDVFGCRCRRSITKHLVYFTVIAAVCSTTTNSRATHPSADGALSYDIAGFCRMLFFGIGCLLLLLLLLLSSVDHHQISRLFRQTPRLFHRNLLPTKGPFV